MRGRPVASGNSRRGDAVTYPRTPAAVDCPLKRIILVD